MDDANRSEDGDHQLDEQLESIATAMSRSPYKPSPITSPTSDPPRASAGSPLQPASRVAHQTHVPQAA